MIKKGEIVYEGIDFEILASDDFAEIEELRELINRKGLSMRKVSAHLGVNASTICRWLNSDTKPHPVVMKVMPSFLLDIDRLYPDVEKSPGLAHVTLSRLAALQRMFPGDTDLWTQALDGLELMPADLFAQLLSSSAPQSEIEGFIVGFGELARSFPQIQEALERGER